MSNGYYNKQTSPLKKSGGAGGSNKASGGGVSSGREGTAAWPGLPGKTQSKSRAGGAPTTGHCGQFYVKKEGI